MPALARRRQKREISLRKRCDTGDLHRGARVEPVIGSADDSDVRDSDAGELFDDLIEDLESMRDKETWERGGPDHAGKDDCLAGRRGRDAEDATFAEDDLSSDVDDAALLVGALG